MNKYRMLAIVHRAVTKTISTGEIHFSDFNEHIELVSGFVFCLDDRLTELYEDYDILSYYEDGKIIFHT